MIETFLLGFALGAVCTLMAVAAIACLRVGDDDCELRVDTPVETDMGGKAVKRTWLDDGSWYDEEVDIER